jgi:hypothetical protein
LIGWTKGEKAGKAAIGAISTRTERLVMGCLDAVSTGLRGRSKPSLVVPKALAWRPMGSSIERSNALHRTYAPADEMAVQNVDELAS